MARSPNKVVPIHDGAEPLRASLDDTDLAIVRALQANARATYTEVGRAVGLSAASVHERVHRLETRGVIRGYHAEVDPELLGLSVLSLVSVVPSDSMDATATEAALAALPEVETAWSVAGEDSHLLVVRTRSIARAVRRPPAPPGHRRGRPHPHRRRPGHPRPPPPDGLVAADQTPPAAERTSQGVQRMFDRVAPRYDLANTVFSMGQDKGWRVAAARATRLAAGEVAVDVACGTGGLARELETLAPGATVAGFDFSLEMLAQGPRGRVAAGDALQLPLADASVDVVTIAFGLRNLPEPGQGLLEFRRVLRPGGRLVVCEFSTPVVPVLRDVYRRYLTRLMPVAARRLTSDPEAYQYLARSIGAWPDQPALARWLQDAGFGEVAWRNLTGGIVALHRGVARP